MLQDITEFLQNFQHFLYANICSPIHRSCPGVLPGVQGATCGACVCDIRVPTRMHPIYSGAEHKMETVVLEAIMTVQ